MALCISPGAFRMRDPEDQPGPMVTCTGNAGRSPVLTGERLKDRQGGYGRCTAFRHVHSHLWYLLWYSIHIIKGHIFCLLNDVCLI